MNIDNINVISEILKHTEENVELVRVFIRYPTDIDSFYEELSSNFYSYVRNKLYVQAAAEYDSNENPRKRFRCGSYSVCQDFEAVNTEKGCNVTLFIKIKRGKDTVFSRSLEQKWDFSTYGRHSQSTERGLLII